MTPTSTGPAFIDRDEAIRRIRGALRARTGRTWSVTAGRGTTWGWVTIHAPPARRGEYGTMTGEDCALLAQALGLPFVHDQGAQVPDASDYRAEYVDRAEGRAPAVTGAPCWD